MHAFQRNSVEERAKTIRKLTVDCIGKLGIGHIGGCLSIADLLAVLYNAVMNIDPQNPKMPGRDRLIISKGHAGPALYAALADKGYFSISELDTLNRPGTGLPSHCDMNKTTGVDMTTGSLGQGFSCAVGAAIGAKLRKDNAIIYTIIGDGESQEGQIWEAAMLAGHRRLSNLIAFTDYNHMQIDGTTNEVNTLDNLPAKWAAFNWNVVDVAQGNDVEKIYDAILQAKQCGDKPTMIILHTVKGKGVSFIEAAGCGNHNMSVTPEQYRQALLELS